MKLIFNPRKHSFFINDFGGIKVKPESTIDLKKYKVSENLYERSLQFGALKDAVENGYLLLVDAQPAYVAEKYHVPTQITTASVTKRRRKLLTPYNEEQEIDFIEQLQAEFGLGSLTGRSEAEISKNTDKLINTVDFDGFIDPSDS